MFGKFSASHDGDSYTRLLTSKQKRLSKSGNKGGRKHRAEIAPKVAWQDCLAVGAANGAEQETSRPLADGAHDTGANTGMRAWLYDDLPVADTSTQSAR
jgi:hypothetical protein